MIAVGGTALNGCSGTSRAGFTSETTWSGSGGGTSAAEPVPGCQSSYTGPVSGASTITALTGSKRGIPGVSFDANPSTGAPVYDSTRHRGQSGWFTLGGTSVGPPNWAGVLAAGNAAGKTALPGHSAIYPGGYATNLKDITSGTNGTCGTDRTAGSGLRPGDRPRKPGELPIDSPRPRGVIDAKRPDRLSVNWGRALAFRAFPAGRKTRDPSLATPMFC